MKPDIDFIKWCFDKAGIKYKENADGLFMYVYNNASWHIGTLLFKNILWSYVLQKAIEGVNKMAGYYVIEIPLEMGLWYARVDGWDIDAMDGTINKCKESALKHIYEQEKS